MRLSEVFIIRESEHDEWDKLLSDGEFVNLEQLQQRFPEAATAWKSLFQKMDDEEKSYYTDHAFEVFNNGFIIACSTHEMAAVLDAGYTWFPDRKKWEPWENHDISKLRDKLHNESTLHEGGKNVTVTFDSAAEVDTVMEVLYEYLEKSRTFDPWTENVHPQKDIRDVYDQIERSNMRYLWDNDERDIVKAAITLYVSKHPNTRYALSRIMAKLG